MKNELTIKLGIKYPIIQAPMAGGPTTSRLVAAVSNAGGLGTIGAGYMSPEQIRKQIREVKALTNDPFGVNLFVPSPYTVVEEQILAAKGHLQPIKDKLQVKEEEVQMTGYLQDMEVFHQQVNVVMEEKVPVCSFTFGIPEKDVLSSFKENSIMTIGTATTVQEAIMVQEAGMDAVVVQGSEAGGHRGSFIENASDSLVGLMALLPQAADRVGIPVIAAGGIMDGRGLAAAQLLGAKAVQMGTAFLTCEESGAAEIYKEAILMAFEDQTALTKAFSGKMARGIVNQYMIDMKPYEDQLPPYPVQNELTKVIRKEAAVQKNQNYVSLWSGQSPRLARSLNATTLIQMIITEAEKAGRMLFEDFFHKD